MALSSASAFRRARSMRLCHMHQCWRQQRLALQGCTSVQSLAIFGIGFSPCPLDATVCHMLLCWRQQRLALQGCTSVQSLPIIGVGLVPSRCSTDVALRRASMLASPIISRVAVLSTHGEQSATTLCSSLSVTPSKASSLQQQSAETAQLQLCLVPVATASRVAVLHFACSSTCATAAELGSSP